MVISLNLNEHENLLVSEYAQSQGLDLGELVREALLEKIEEEQAELKFAQKLEKEIQTDPDYQVFLSTEELERELGL